MSDPRSGTGADDAAGLDAAELDTYFALMEAVSLLQHSVEQQLRAEGDLSYVQFQLLARLAAARGQLTMTELADGVVYSRSGLTYQAALLEKAGLVTRSPSTDDERATVVALRAALAEIVADPALAPARDALFLSDIWPASVHRFGMLRDVERGAAAAGYPQLQ